MYFLKGLTPHTPSNTNIWTKCRIKQPWILLIDSIWHLFVAAAARSIWMCDPDPWYADADLRGVTSRAAPQYYLMFDLILLFCCIWNFLTTNVCQLNLRFPSIGASMYEIRAGQLRTATALTSAQLPDSSKFLAELQRTAAPPLPSLSYL